MAEYLDSIAAVDDDDSSDSEYIWGNEEVSLDSFIDNSTVDNNPSDYCGLINVTISMPSPEEGIFSDSNI